MWYYVCMYAHVHNTVLVYKTHMWFNKQHTYVCSKVKANSVQSLPSIHMNLQYVRTLSKGWRTTLKDIQTIIMTM